MTQTPGCKEYLLRWQGDELEVTLKLDAPRKGRAVLRSNFGAASVRRREIIAANDRGETPLARAWNDRPMDETEPGVFKCTVPLSEVGVFSGKCCFFPAAKGAPGEWPEGANFHVTVEPAETRSGNSIYTVFPRQFGSFREVARRLDLIMDRMGFRIVQTLPVFPVPTTYAVMGEYGCPFAATDFFSVDPAMAEFDTRTTPLDQFRLGIRPPDAPSRLVPSRPGRHLHLPRCMGRHMGRPCGARLLPSWPPLLHGRGVSLLGAQRRGRFPLRRRLHDSRRDLDLHRGPRA